ncbi:MAG TPA: tRNA pseudouridine(13) synthase TruD [Leucothrix sp.]|nr:tRNA pseudouridine(13) synthase TruD [Leucothrix sp.]
MSSFCKVNADRQLSGTIRTKPEDFQVDEIQSFTASGQGEHVWLHIKKTGENTDWVAGQLAKIAEVPRRDVSFAGMKDRNAVTTQWFSVQMPGREAPNWQESLPDSIEVLDEKRHDRKLKRGTLEGNRFKIKIRDFQGSEEQLKAAINQIREQGIPNYFGEQRFGHGGFNVQKAEQWFKGEFKVKSRQKRSIYLSAARSWIFNHVLSERVKNGTWNQAIEGDVFMLSGTKSSFFEEIDDTIIERVSQQDIHPTGVLWGRGRLSSQSKVAELEQKIAEQCSVLCDGLERNGLKQERKALRLKVKDLNYRYFDTQKTQSDVILSFTLPAGAYATSVLGEIGCFGH